MTLPAGYDQWKLAEPTEEAFDRDDEDRDADETCGPDEDDDPDRDRCVLGDRCCCPHVFHGAAECFDAEMAEAMMGDEQPDRIDAADREALRWLKDRCHLVRSWVRALDLPLLERAVAVLERLTKEPT